MPHPGEGFGGLAWGEDDPGDPQATGHASGATGERAPEGAGGSLDADGKGRAYAVKFTGELGLDRISRRSCFQICDNVTGLLPRVAQRPW